MGYSENISVLNSAFTMESFINALGIKTANTAFILVKLIIYLL